MSPAYATTFAVLDIRPEPYAVTPILSARVGIASIGEEPVHAIALRAQVRIDPGRRSYSDVETAGLLDLFGPRERWSQTQRSFLWMHCATTIPGFSGGAEVDLPMSCTYDFEVAASKYLHALRAGTVPLLFLFSGTVFIRGSTGFAVQQIPWDREDRYDMPVAVWQELMATQFPETGWVRLREDTMAALAQFKAQHGLLNFDDTVGHLLATAEESA
ncbi:DUF6084 family protein [Nocardia stercoris]|uniref:Uncharacterized protein n=1 Tax=Nocardia stercoris TaxID=2483361 RepID=A0A3M2KSZ8_9NOCA|nr:DUF6084 family protein [Nocardia stercoris]RMI28579.1 hypothetical protein EBN03_29665 [Nocardia stercoris]